MNLLGMFGIKVKTKQAAKIVKTDNNSVLDESKPSELKIYQQSVYDKYMGKMQKENHLNIVIRHTFSCDELNTFIEGLTNVLKRYHPYELRTNHRRCNFEMPESATYHPTDDFKFDLNQPIPQDVFDRVIGPFGMPSQMVVAVDDYNNDLIYKLVYYKNLGQIYLEMGHMNNITYSEVLMYLFSRGYDIS